MPCEGVNIGMNLGKSSRCWNRTTCTLSFSTKMDWRYKFYHYNWSNKVYPASFQEIFSKLKIIQKILL